MEIGENTTETSGSHKNRQMHRVSNTGEVSMRDTKLRYSRVRPGDKKTAKTLIYVSNCFNQAQKITS